MSAVTKSGIPSLTTMTPGYEHKQSGLLAGEALGAFDACYINSTDGKVYKSTAAAANAAAVIDGYAASPAAAGDAVTLLADVNVAYGSSLTPGSFLYLSATVAGGLDTAASSNQPAPAARVITSSRIHVLKSY